MHINLQSIYCEFDQEEMSRTRNGEDQEENQIDFKEPMQPQKLKPEMLSASSSSNLSHQLRLSQKPQSPDLKRSSRIKISIPQSVQSRNYQGLLLRKAQESPQFKQSNVQSEKPSAKRPEIKNSELSQHTGRITCSDNPNKKNPKLPYNNMKEQSLGHSKHKVQIQTSRQKGIISSSQGRFSTNSLIYSNFQSEEEIYEESSAKKPTFIRNIDYSVTVHL